MASRKEKAAEKQLEREIERIYRENCSGIEINIMDISKIFEAGKQAAKNGTDVKTAILAAVEKLRQN